MTTNDKAVISAIDDEHETRWYVVNTYAGHENRVKENLGKDGKPKDVKTNVFPGYLFVEMKMTDEAWYVVRNTPGVTGFIGSSGGGAKPFPVAPDEMEAILRRIGQSDKKISIDFEIGDTVKILAGPFSGMEGRVASLNDQTQTANVLIMLFGRETPTDINYGDLEKVELF